MLKRTTVTSMAFAAVAAAPASAQTPTLTPLKPCYVVAQPNQREPIGVEAKGFTPFAFTTVLVDEVEVSRPRASLDGSVLGMVPAPEQDRGTRPFRLRVTQVDNPAITVTATTMVTRLGVEQKPSSASTSQRVQFRGRGFTDLSRPVYAHYVFAGKSRRTVRIGLPDGPCGTFKVRRPQFPFKRSPRIGTWTIQFDQLPYYDAKAGVRVPMTIKVRKTPKRASARAR